MNLELIKNNYLVVPNLLSFDKAKQLAAEFEFYAVSNNLPGDSQAPNSNSKYNWSSTLELLCELTPTISKYSETTVLPTYSYTRVYRTGDDLKKHCDRDSCEISVTINLDGDCEWPIYIERPDKSIASVILKPGDAMIYLGCRANHWRKIIPGSKQVQTFLHYVDSKGEKSEYYFDRFLTGTQQTHIPQLQEIVDAYEPIDYSNVPKNIEDYIQTFDNIIPLDLCDKIVNEFENSEEWASASIGSGNVNTNVRNVKNILIDDLSIIHKNMIDRNQIVTQLNGVLFFVVNKYKRQFAPGLHASKHSGYELLKYTEGCFYKEHTDSYIVQPRHLAISLHLNDDYEGGEFGFLNGKLKIKAKKGSALVFPSNFMYPHEIFPVTKGIRHAIITWII